MIQIDMPMPTNCLDCPVCNEYLICAIPVNGRKWGENDVREFGQGRPEWCPMKEQEAVEPQRAPFPDASRSDGSWYYICGTCSKPIDPKDMYCRHCGKPVKWE